MKDTLLKKDRILAMLLVFVLAVLPMQTVQTEAAASSCVSCGTCKIAVGGTQTLNVKGAGKNADVTYQSSKKSVATVSKKGKVTGIAEGKAKITVCLKKNKKTTTYCYTVCVEKPKKCESGKSSGAGSNVTCVDDISKLVGIVCGNGNNACNITDIVNSYASNTSRQTKPAETNASNTDRKSDNTSQKQPADTSNSAKTSLDETTVYNRMIALKSKYPEGMRWTNANSYYSKGMRLTGYGCVGFALILSDAAFGENTPATKVNSPSASSVRVGDILRVNNDTHSVIVLEVRADSFVIAEGNYNSSIHWGRVMPKTDRINYLYTRY